MSTSDRGLRPELRLAEEVQRALEHRQPVVALESTVITYGLPRPINAETARACEAEIRAEGAVPATIALAAGELRVGIDAALLDALATGADVRKVSTRDIAPVLARLELGATTVAASVEIAALAGIRVFSTGGIGGVHRGASETDDVSADLLAIARHPVCVVCAGAKSFLDIAKTLERLEALGVPVVAVGADEFPAFTVRSSGLRAPYRADDASEIAEITRLRLAQGGGIVVALPIAVELSLDERSAERAIAEALADAERIGMHGGDVTPFLLSAIASRDERAPEANVALLRANARLAARVAAALAAG